MANASRDQNNVETLLGAMSTNGTTTVPIKAGATSYRLIVSNGSTGTDYGPVEAPRDENFVPALMAVSSADGVTPVVVYADSDGALLIDTN